MKTCLLISGYLRSFESTIDNLREKILNQFDCIDVYVHLTQNEHEEDKYVNKINYNFIEKIHNELNPKCLLVEPNLNVIEKKNNVLYNQWIKFYKLNEIKKLNEKLHGEYDIVIKTRPDVFLYDKIILDIESLKHKILIPSDSKIDLKKLTKNTDNFLCDSLAIGSSENMNLYFDLFKNLNTLTEKHGYVSETILYEYLTNKIDYELIDLNYCIILSNCNVFAICGDSGSGKTTLSEKLSKYFDSPFILEGDRYHKWERNDKNWSYLTHLNPNANYIAKMSQDIFDLKIGKSIYQVDYDHNSGKFTTEQKIENSQNIIVCGLHSLYSDNNELYNLRIFMDTDEKLRTKWKIKRDTEKRGYSLDKIKDQINKRKNDYIEYIEPQKKKSNVIINFYEKKDFSVGLKIKVHTDIVNQRQISIITENFKGLKTSINDDFYVFDFPEYMNYDILDSLSYRSYDYYDYIIYILLKVKIYG